LFGPSLPALACLSPQAIELPDPVANEMLEVIALGGRLTAARHGE